MALIINVNKLQISCRIYNWLQIRYKFHMGLIANKLKVLYGIDNYCK